DLGLERDLAALPGAPAHRHGRLQQRELVGPGREAALAAVVVELGQHGDQRVVGALYRDVVELGAGAAPPASGGRRPGAGARASARLVLRLEGGEDARRQRRRTAPLDQLDQRVY